MESQYLKNIEKGYKVEILTDAKKLVSGIVENVLSRSSYSFYGIRVRLKGGEIGRVQKVFLTEEQKLSQNAKEIERMIKSGENFNVEFKSEALWSLDYSDEKIKQSKSFDLHTYKQKTSKVIIARSIAAFMNSSGGNLIIGVKEKKDSGGNFELIDIREEFKKLKDPSFDGYKRMIIDDIIRQYFPAKVYNNLNEYLSINFVEVDGKVLCVIKINKSDSWVFLNIHGKEIFMIRTETENRILEGEKLVDYCMKRFGR